MTSSDDADPGFFLCLRASVLNISYAETTGTA
jgi:hypothetical protein